MKEYKVTQWNRCLLPVVCFFGWDTTSHVLGLSSVLFTAQDTFSCRSSTLLHAATPFLGRLLGRSTTWERKTEVDVGYEITSCAASQYSRDGGAEGMFTQRTAGAPPHNRDDSERVCWMTPGIVEKKRLLVLTLQAVAFVAGCYPVACWDIQGNILHSVAGNHICSCRRFRRRWFGMVERHGPWEQVFQVICVKWTRSSLRPRFCSLSRCNITELCSEHVHRLWMRKDFLLCFGWFVAYLKRVKALLLCNADPVGDKTKPFGDRNSSCRTDFFFFFF